MHIKSILAIAALAIAPCGLASAVPLSVSFTVTGLGAGAPESSITGSFTYEAAGLNAPLTSLTSINLAIAGHTYTLAEVAGESVGAYSLIGGALCAVTCITSRTDDFWLIWNVATHTGFQFAHTSTSSSGFWSGSFSQFSVTAVPEPASLALLGTGLFAMFGFRRRFNKSKV